MLSLYTFGDSMLDSGRYNDRGLDAGQLIVKNDDALFPEFKGRDLTTLGPCRLVHRAKDGAKLNSLWGQLRDVAPEGPAVAMVTIGGNNLLGGLIADPGPGLDAFGPQLEAYLDALTVRPVLLGNVYDPTFGDDARARTALGMVGDMARLRANFARINATIAAIAARVGTLVDLHAHFLTGQPAWLTAVIEPSLLGASEVRRCFLPHVLAARKKLAQL